MPEAQSGICFFNLQGHLARPANPFGKDIANAALFRALVQHGGFSDVAVLHQAGLSPEQLAAEMAFATAPGFVTASLDDTALPARHGALLRGQPYLAELSSLRRAAGLDQAYSLVGLIHTIAPPAIRQLIGDAALAPPIPGMRWCAPPSLCSRRCRRCLTAGPSISRLASAPCGRRARSCP